MYSLLLRLLQYPKMSDATPQEQVVTSRLQEANHGFLKRFRACWGLWFRVSSLYLCKLGVWEFSSSGGLKGVEESVQKMITAS